VNDPLPPSAALPLTERVLQNLGHIVDQNRP
jgi:hypothetical protein